MQADTPVVIVGAGPVGVRAAVELRQALPQAPIVLYGDEPWHQQVLAQVPVPVEVAN